MSKLLKLAIFLVCLSSVGHASIDMLGNQPIIFSTGSTSTTLVERLRITSDARVGVGVSSPVAALNVNGSIVSQAYSAGSSRSIDWSRGNMQYTTATCGAFTFTNMQDGGSYTLAVRGSGTTTCSFTHSGLTFNLPNDHGATTTSTHTLYSFVRMGTNVYVAWMSGI